MVPIVPRTFAEVGMEGWAGILFFLFFSEKGVRVDVIGKRVRW